MGRLCITECDNLANTPLGPTQCPHMPPVAEQKLTIGPEQDVSKPFGEKTRFIRVRPDEDCCLAFAMPDIQHIEAVPGLHVLGAGEVAWYGVRHGMRLAVIQDEPT